MYFLHMIPRGQSQREGRPVCFFLETTPGSTDWTSKALLLRSITILNHRTLHLEHLLNKFQIKQQLHWQTRV
jgi:hypothetical protein